MKDFGALLVSVIVLPPLLGRAAEAGKERVVFEESFAGRLKDGWSWVREDPSAWKIDKNGLVIRTSMGSLWQKDNNNRNILLRALPEAKGGRVAVEVLVDNEPTNAFEHAGLVWYADDDNYVALLKEKIGKNVIVQLVSETQGRPKVGFAEKPYNSKAVWLRLEIAGGKATGLFHGVDSNTWQALGKCDVPPAQGAGRIGLMTGYAAKGAEHHAHFSNFRLLQETK